MILEISFFSFSNIDVDFVELGKLTWRSYNIAEALPTTSWVEFIDKKEFVKTALDENFKTFIVYVEALEAEISIDLLRTA